MCVYLGVGRLKFIVMNYVGKHWIFFTGFVCGLWLVNTLCSRHCTCVCVCAYVRVSVCLCESIHVYGFVEIRTILKDSHKKTKIFTYQMKRAVNRCVL